MVSPAATPPWSLPICDHFSVFHCLLILTVSRGPGQVFCRKAVHSGLSEVFLIQPRLWIWGERLQRRSSLLIPSSPGYVAPTSMMWPPSLSHVLFARRLRYRVAFLLLPWSHFLEMMQFVGFKMQDIVTSFCLQGLHAELGDGCRLSSHTPGLRL